MDGKHWQICHVRGRDGVPGYMFGRGGICRELARGSSFPNFNLTLLLYFTK
jgi:hypothetical protein